VVRIYDDAIRVVISGSNGELGIFMNHTNCNGSHHTCRKGGWGE